MDGQCLDTTTDREMKSHGQIKRVLGGVSLHPCNLFHRLKYPHQLTKGWQIILFLLPGVKVGLCQSNSERPLAVSRTRYGLILGCSHPKGMTTSRQDKFPTGRSARMVQECILVEAGHKEEVASCLATERCQSYSNVKLVDLCKGATST